MRGVSISAVPQEGCLLATFDDQVLFESYSVREGRLVFEGCEAFEDRMPLECHLFDQDREYRMVARRSRGDCIEKVFSTQDEEALDSDQIYVASMMVQERFAKPGVPSMLKAVNRYRYTEGDTLVLDSYRLSW